MMRVPRVCQVVVVGWLVLSLSGCTGVHKVRAPARPKPGDDNRLVADAVRHYDAGRYAESIAACDAALKINGSHANAYKQRALARMRVADATPRGRTLLYMDLNQAVQNSGMGDPVSLYLMAVYHLDGARENTDTLRVKDLATSRGFLAEARKLDPENPYYEKAEEYVQAQLYFARRDAGQLPGEYRGEYADVVRFGDTIPYGEMVSKGMVPAKAEPRRHASDETVNNGMAVVFGIAALVVANAALQGEGSGPVSVGKRSRCHMCNGQGGSRQYNHILRVMEWTRCRTCSGTGSINW